MIPLLDLRTYKLRTNLLEEYIEQLENERPGFTEQTLRSETSPIYAVLRKRYGRGAAGFSSLPFGQKAPPLTATGTTPPALTLSGVPTLGGIRMRLEITLGGVLGVAAFRWSQDAGQTWGASNVVSASSVVLGSTGLSVPFPPAPATFATDNVYTAEAPVPETILNWLRARTDLRVLIKIGYAGANEGTVELVKAEAELSRTEMQEAANGKNSGLWDLPDVDDGESAVTTGGVISYSESSPFVSADRQEREAVLEDCRGMGSFLPSDPWWPR